MAGVKIFYDPVGINLDTLGKTKYWNLTDGDTPYVITSIRMLSIDAPEVHYPGNQKPSKSDEKLKQLADWIKQGKAPVNDDLAAHLYPKLATGKAGTLQENQGLTSKLEFKKLLDKMLTKPSGRRRNIFLRAADEHFDQYGRLLAYIAPAYTRKERETLSVKQRATFNLMMVESGWAAPFPIYPSIPKHSDLKLLQQAAQEAFSKKKGAWSDPNAIPGYEYRMCIRLHDITKKLVAGKKLSAREKYAYVYRFCVDMTTKEIFYPQYYHKVELYNRIFIWPEDVNDAVGMMNLIPAER